MEHSAPKVGINLFRLDEIKYRGKFMIKKTGYDALMHTVCVEWGFCRCIKKGKPLHVDDFIPNFGKVTADQFVEWVFLADNMDPDINPERWRKHKDAIKEAFIEHMESDVVEAYKLTWELR